MRLVGYAGIGHAGSVRPPVDRDVWLRSYDPEARGGYGEVEWTADPSRAMTFPDAAAALACYSQVPANHPIRSSDGKPNRPLTACSIEIEHIPTKENGP